MAYFRQRYVRNNLHIRFFIFSAVAFFSGCAVSAPVSRVYVATIERIDQQPGDYYSLQKGHKPRMCLYLRIVPASAKAQGELLRVFLMDLYSPVIHGRQGDNVSFSCAGDLPVSGELNFESLDHYRPVPNGG